MQRERTDLQIGAVGEGEGRMNGQSRMETYTPLCMK